MTVPPEEGDDSVGVPPDVGPQVVQYLRGHGHHERRAVLAECLVCLLHRLPLRGVLKPVRRVDVGHLAVQFVNGAQCHQACSSAGFQAGSSRWESHRRKPG